MPEPPALLPTAGRLLVANPLLPDPNFDRTVVLLLACSEEGALGLVLNRPSETLVGAPLPGWAPLAASPKVVFVGGPVGHEDVICLARPAHPGFGGRADGWRAVSPAVGTLDLSLDPDVLGSAFRGLRIFAGYSGWGPRQLESEMEAGAWWVVEADPQDPFCDNPERLWTAVLRRQANSLALVSYFPSDVSAN
jgi:putative transcriptional regulator